MQSRRGRRPRPPEPLVAALQPWDGRASIYVVMNEPDGRLLAGLPAFESRAKRVWI